MPLILDPHEALKQLQFELSCDSPGFDWPVDIDELKPYELKELANNLYDVIQWHERTLNAIDSIVDEALFVEILKS